MLPCRAAKAKSIVSWLLGFSLVVQPCLCEAGQSVDAWKPAASNVQQATAAIDIALRPDGTFVGQLVDTAGRGSAQTDVSLTDGRRNWQAKTDQQGWFRFADLQGKQYEFQTEGVKQRLRVWPANAAPPIARPGLLVTPSADVFRGQRVLSPNTNQFFRVAKQRLTNPLVIGGVAVTAVAIPVAIHNSDDDEPASP